MYQNKIGILEDIFTQNGLKGEDVDVFTQWYQKYTKNMFDRSEMDDIRERLTQYFDMFKKYGKTPKTFIQLFRKRPAILLREPKTLEHNLLENAKLLNLFPQTVLDMTLKQPSFLLGNPQKHKNNADTLADIFQTSVEKIIQIAVKQPQLLYHDTKEIEKKYQLYQRCYYSGLFTLKDDTSKDRAIMKKAYHEKNEAVLQNYTERLAQRLLNDPTLLFLGVDNIRIKMGYARFLRAQNQSSTSDVFRKSKTQIQQVLDKAPVSFKEKNKPTYRLFQSNKAKD